VVDPYRNQGMNPVGERPPPEACMHSRSLRGLDAGLKRVCSFGDQGPVQAQQTSRSGMLGSAASQPSDG
jgi:hypothetical protein